MPSVTRPLWLRVATVVAVAWSALWVLAIYAGSAGSLGAGGGIRCTVMNVSVFMAALLGVCACGIATFEAFTTKREWSSRVTLLLALGGALLPFALVPVLLLLEPAHGCP